MFLKDSVLNLPRSAQLCVTVYNPSSLNSPMSTLTPTLWNLLSVNNAYFGPTVWHAAQFPFFAEVNTRNPRFTDALTAFSSCPYFQRSNGELPLITVRSNEAMLFSTIS